MDPTEDEQKQMDKLAAVFTWVGLPAGEMNDETKLAGSLARLLGATQDTKPVTLGVVSKGDYEAVISRWKVPETAGARPPTLAEIGAAKLVGHVCRLLAGAGETLESLKKKAHTQQPSTAAPSISTAAARRIKLSSIVSQVDDTEILMADEKEVLKAFARYETVYGKGDRPPNGTEPTSEQLSAVKHLLDSNCCPYTDFSVFGPYGQRIYKKVKLSGYQIARDGPLTSVELHGPSNIAQWIGCYTVLQNILVMLDAVDLGHLLRYKSMIERYHDKYGEKVWSVIYQGDVRCRLENMPRIKRIAQAAYDKAVSAGNSSDYDPARPWNHVWLKAPEDLEFWRKEVVDPSFLILTKIANKDEILQGDATTNSSKGGPRETAPNASRIAEQAQSSSMRPRNTSRTGRLNNVENGRYTTNRTGYKICAGYNDDKCTQASQGIWCTQSWDTVHQCSRCLGSHPVSKCPHSDMPKPGFLKGPGKGRGKGGRKGRSGRPPY